MECGLGNKYRNNIPNRFGYTFSKGIKDGSFGYTFSKGIK
jgi:hypothetical protein